MMIYLFTSDTVLTEADDDMMMMIMRVIYLMLCWLLSVIKHVAT